MRKRSAAAAVIGFSLAFISCRTMAFPVSAEPDGYVKITGDSLRFWQTVMTPAVARHYRATKKNTFCNLFVMDIIRKYFGSAIRDRVFPDGLRGPDIVSREWQGNPHLVRLDPAHYPPRRIQDLADQGYLVLLAYYNKNGKSHLAFVGNTGLKMFTVPPIKKLEAKPASGLASEWLPVVVQAGTYCGVTSVAYATNGWFSSAINPFQAGRVKFYLVRS